MWCAVLRRHLICSSTSQVNLEAEEVDILHMKGFHGLLQYVD